MALNINRLHKFNDLVCELSAVKIILKIADASGGRQFGHRGRRGGQLGKCCGRPLWMPPNNNASYILSYVFAMVDQVYGNKSVATNGTVETLQCHSTTDPTLAVFSGSRCLLCTKIFLSPFSGTCAVFTFPLPDTR